jgi:site-specific recombinase XerD
MRSRLQGLRVAAWPDVDRTCWKACWDSGHLARLSPRTARQIELLYGHWLAALLAWGALDATAPPSERAMDANAGAYITALRQEGYAARTIGSHLWKLRTALRAMEPGREISWVHLPEWSGGLYHPPRQRQPRVAKDPLATWPDDERLRWQACRGAGPLARQSSHTRRQIAYGYSCWLGFLRSRGTFDATARPSVRASDDNVAAYIAALRQQSCAARTIGSRLWKLQIALRVLEPGVEISWIHLPAWSAEFYRRRRSQPRSPKQDPLAAWPDIDRVLWRVGMKPGDLLEGSSYSARLADGTKQMTACVYSNWLSWLRKEDRLDSSARPAERVTRDNAGDWVRAMHARGNCAKTIALQLSSLRSALRIMQPERDFRWLTVPSAASLAGRTAERRRSVRFVDSDVLFAWGREVMEAAVQLPTRAGQAVMFRNGLLIAVLAARAPRRRSLAALTATAHVIRNDAVYRIVLGKLDMKTRKRHEFDLPPILTPFIDRYLNEFRPVLAGRRNHHAFWLTPHGGPLSAGRISGLILEASKQRFGVAFGPHRFRHALGSTAPTRDPAHPGVASAILGIDRKTLQDHYNVASETEAAIAYLDGIRHDRQRTQCLVRRAFRQDPAHTGRT